MGLLACPRPPVSAEGEGEGDTDRVVVDLPSFLQDRPAIGGKWYEYNVDGHILEPKDEAWVVVAADGSVSGFRIDSVYDDDTGDSGVFTLSVVQRDADNGAWSAPQTFVSSGNVKDGPPLCMTLSTLNEQPCDDDDGYDLRFVLQSRLSVFAGFAVAEPAVYLAPLARAARVDGVALDALPDPATLSVLDDDDAGFDSTEWDYAALAPDLPSRGQVFGAVDRVVGETWGLVDAHRNLVEFSVAAIDQEQDGTHTLRFTLRRQPIAVDDGSVPADLGAARDVDVDVSSPPVFVSFESDDLRTPPADLDDVSWPARPPRSRNYDLVVVDDAAVAGGLRILMSPATAALHESAL